MIFNTQVNKAHIGLMKTKHEQTSRVSALKCEDHDHESIQLSSIIP